MKCINYRSGCAKILNNVYYTILYYTILYYSECERGECFATYRIAMYYRPSKADYGHAGSAILQLKTAEFLSIFIIQSAEYVLFDLKTSRGMLFIHSAV